MINRQEACDTLSKADPVMKRLIGEVGVISWPKGKGEPYHALIRAVMHQQVHGKAAAAIMRRFLALFAMEEGDFPSPDAILRQSAPVLRGVGLSENKMLAVMDIAAKADAGLLPTRRQCVRRDDQTLIEQLTAVRGVGRWTVEMMLMFTLNRPDVLPVDDFGVREGYRLIYGEVEQPKPKALLAIGQQWQPYRTMASLYLWRGLELYRARAKLAVS